MSETNLPPGVWDALCHMTEGTLTTIEIVHRSSVHTRGGSPKSPTEEHFIRFYGFSDGIRWDESVQCSPDPNLVMPSLRNLLARIARYGEPISRMVLGDYGEMPERAKVALTRLAHL